MQPDLHLENGHVYTSIIISNDAEFCEANYKITLKNKTSKCTMTANRN